MVQTYSEKLQHPLWQAKRLHILERDNYTCQCCQDKETNLQIHHFFYAKGLEPWDYEDKDLITYCKHCHALTEYFKPHQWHHTTFNVFKYRTGNTVTIIALISDIQNQKHCFMFEYENELDFIFSLPAHVVNRIDLMFQQQKQLENGEAK